MTCDVNAPLITPAQADAYISLIPPSHDPAVTDWLALPDAPDKEYHIQEATNYFQSRSVCADEQGNVQVYDPVDNPPPATVENAIALYALESFKGNLYPEPGSTAVTGAVTLTRDQVGPLETERRYSDRVSTTTNPDPFPHITALLSGCCRVTHVVGAGGICQFIRTG